jgi:hypothetical protein
VKLVSVVVLRDDADVLDAHLRFHLNAGVDLALVAGGDDDEESASVLEPYVRSGHVVRSAGAMAELAQRAVSEHAADWVLPADGDEFWWPRGESLKDVLAAIPPRYEVVQGLVRVFLPAAAEAEPFSESMIVRASLLRSREHGAEPLEWALRPLYRALPDLSPEAGDDRRIPMRAWYPIEVLRFPFRSAIQAERTLSAGDAPRSKLEADAAEARRSGRLPEWYTEVAGGSSRAQGLADGTLVEDTRLRDAVQLLGPHQPEHAARLVLTPPGVVDDASYAIECAAVGEVDLAKLERQIRELEGRITWLEERFWTRVLRNMRRIVRR